MFSINSELQFINGRYANIYLFLKHLLGRFEKLLSVRVSVRKTNRGLHGSDEAYIYDKGKDQKAFTRRLKAGGSEERE